jgi:ribose-phosphate pyrophosphokinase
VLIILGNSLSPSLSNYFNEIVTTTESLTILESSLGKFKSSESFAEILGNPANLNHQPVTIIQSLGATNDQTSNDYAMQLLQSIHTLKRNGAGNIWVIAPFMAYSRQDRAFDGRMTSIGIDDFAFLLKQVGAVGVSTIEMHSETGLDLMKENLGRDAIFNLTPTDLFANYIKGKCGNDNFTVGGPDAGASARAEAVRKVLNAGEFKFKKIHTGINETKVTSFEGNVKNCTSLTIDDMIDTGGTIKNAQDTLEKNGAAKRIVMAAHGIFSEGGLEKLFNAKANDGASLIQEIIVTDTIDVTTKLEQLRKQYGTRAVDARVTVLSTAPMIMNHIKTDLINHPLMQPINL